MKLLLASLAVLSAAPSFAATSGVPRTQAPPPALNYSVSAQPRCLNAQGIAEINALTNQVANLAALIKSRQNEISMLMAKRSAVLAAIAAATTPAEKKARQNDLAAIDTKINALYGAIASAQAALNNDNAQIARLKALKPC